MTGRDFLPIAQQLAAGSSEPLWRTAIGRAYYAAFHVARELPIDLGFTVPREERAHKYVIFRLSNAGDSTVEQAGRSLDSLRDFRNLADYDLRRALSAAMAQVRVRLAADVVGILDAVRAEPVRSHVMNAIKAYERDVLQDVTWAP